MAKKGALHFINLSKNFISSELTLKKYRNNVKDFTRKRKLSFEGLSLCMMRLLRQNIQVEIYTYFSALNHAGNSNQISFTSSAFVQSRKKMKPDMFYDLSRIIAEDFYQDNDENVRLYKGHRLLGIDGSTINLPINEMTKQVYGTFNNQKQTNDVVIGRVSIMYDVLNEIVIDGKLCPYKIGEIPLSQEHFKLANENDIIVMDRGYPGFKSMYEMQKRGIHFLYRCKTNFSNKIKEFYASKKQDVITEIKPKQNGFFNDLPYNKETTIRVRLIRIELASGETEILITSLLDKTKYTYSDFKELYYRRWGIEVYYNRLKNIIGVENFSGNSDQFIQQEFNCALYMSNMQSILTKQAQQEANEKYESRKLEYKINSSLSLCFIRNKLVTLFTSNKETEKIMEELKTLFVANVVPVRPNRSFIQLKIYLRKPNWSKELNIEVTGAEISKEDDFYIIEKTWKTGDKLNVSFVNEIFPVAANNDEIALQRGAIVYALEIPHRKNMTKEYEVDGFIDYMVFPTDELYKNVQLIKTPEDNVFGLEYIKGADSSNPWYDGNLHLMGEVYNKELEKLVKVKLVPMGGTTLRRVTFPVK